MEIEDTVLFEILIFENYNEADSRQDDGREKMKGGGGWNLSKPFVRGRMK